MNSSAQRTVFPLISQDTPDHGMVGAAHIQGRGDVIFPPQLNLSGISPQKNALTPR